ncbi:MAG: hypothetical protein LBI03_09495, partial [Clostridiales bacterium]|nr:hypothetical protein [Clostridiales bacterium]
MRQFLTVFKHEFLGLVRNKIFIGITLFAIVVIAVALSFPRIKDAFSEKNNDTQSTTAKSDIAFIDKTGTLSADKLTLYLPGYNITEYTGSEDQMKADTNSGKFASSFVLTAPLAYTEYIKSSSVL